MVENLGAHLDYTQNPEHRRETFNAGEENLRSNYAPFVCLTSFFVLFGVIR
jgi:hypothetical protein